LEQKKGGGLLVAVLFGVGLAGVGRVLGGVVGMSGGRVGVVGGFFVVAGLVVLGGFGVVLGGLRVVGGGVLVVFGGFLRHGIGNFTAYQGRCVGQSCRLVYEKDMSSCELLH